MAKVIIVDDSTVSRHMLADILKAEGHEIIGEAENGLVGVAKYKELKPDLITLDITMPTLDGIGALKEIMAFDPEAKAVMITSLGQNSKMLEALKTGAKNYVLKPFERDKIAAVLREILG